jgi:hypothetical protein
MRESQVKLDLGQSKMALKRPVRRSVAPYSPNGTIINISMSDAYTRLYLAAYFTDTRPSINIGVYAEWNAYPGFW